MTPDAILERIEELKRERQSHLRMARIRAAEIKALEQELKGMITPAMRSTMPYIGVDRPITAMRMILPNVGDRMNKAELKRRLIAGGAFFGKTLPEVRAETSIDVNVAEGNIEIQGDDVVMLRPKRIRSKPR